MHYHVEDKEYRDWIGFEKLWKDLQTPKSERNVTQNYPPYNIIELSENKFRIELAVAGFRKEELTINLEKGILSIHASASLREGPAVNYRHRGIALRDFERYFRLADTVVVLGADLADGILSIDVENVIPESHKLRSIAIGEPKAELLTESDKISSKDVE